MISILLGMAVNVLTYLSTKLKISKTYVSVILSLVLGGAYFFVKMNIGDASMEQLAQWIAEIYATSQIIYNVIEKANEKNDKS